LRHAEMIS